MTNYTSIDVDRVFSPNTGISAFIQLCLMKLKKHAINHNLVKTNLSENVWAERS